MQDDERFVPADNLAPGLAERVRALVNAAEVREGYTVPWLAGRSPDGKRLYPDLALPFEIAGVKTRRTVGSHELAEWLMMNEGHTYDEDSEPPGDAHYIANGIEKLEVEAQGGDWNEYCLELRPLVRETEDPALTNLPPADDWDRRPYEDDDPTLAEEIDAADKSTFAAPASATTGIAGYDLEGAGARRKKRRRKTISTGVPATKESKTMDDLKLFIPITKIDAQKRLVYGVATAERPDVTKEICDYDSTKPLYQKWSDGFAKTTDGKSLGNLRAMHGSVAAGKVTEIAFNDEQKQIEICAKVVDDAEWAKVEEGVYTGFSQGGKYVKRWPDPADAKLTRYTAEPIEVSLVDNPCLPDATFSVVKSDGTTELRKFKAVTPAAAAANPADGDWEQVWISKRLPGKEFRTKAELRQALVDLDAEEAAKKTAAPVLDALAGIKDKLAKAEGGDAGAEAGATANGARAADPAKPAGDGLAKKDYSDDERKQGAKEGWAKKDGSYPIKTPADVGNAVKDWIRSKGSASDKRHIIKRAKALGKAGTDKLPPDWPGSTQKADDSQKTAGDGELAKGASLYSVSNLLLLLDMVQQAEDSAEGNAWGFGPSVDLPKDLTDRFGAALVELGDIAAEMLDVVLGEIKDEEATEALAAAARSIDLSKLALVKVGAKHAKADKERIKKAHDLLADLDPDCCPGGDAEGENADKMIKALQSERDADRKAFEKTLGDIMALVKQIAAQPLPMGTSSVTLRVVDKTNDGAGSGAGASGTEALEELADRALAAARRGSQQSAA